MNKIKANDAMHDLTLALLYLSRFIENPKCEDYWDEDTYRAWKGYDFGVLDKLEEEEYVFGKHGNKSIYISKEGIEKAREMLDKYGISDWTREEVQLRKKR